FSLSPVASPPVVPEYSYHARRTSIRVSRDLTSGIKHQAERVTIVSVAAFGVLISIPPGALSTTWSPTVHCRRIHRSPRGSKSGSATESSRQASPPRLTWPYPDRWRGRVDATGNRPRVQSPSRPPYSGTP